MGQSRGVKDVARGCAVLMCIHEPLVELNTFQMPINTGALTQCACTNTCAAVSTTYRATQHARKKKKKKRYGRCVGPACTLPLIHTRAAKRHGNKTIIIMMK